MSFSTDIEKETSRVLDTLNMLEKFLRETPETVYVYNKSKHIVGGVLYNEILEMST